MQNAKMPTKAPTVLNFLILYHCSTKFSMKIEHTILTNRVVLIFLNFDILAGKYRHELGAKKYLKNTYT